MVSVSACPSRTANLACVRRRLRFVFCFLFLAEEGLEVLEREECLEVYLMLFDIFLAISFLPVDEGYSLYNL